MSPTIKCAYVTMITFVAVFLSHQAYADQFITKSKILKSTGIKIYVGENQKDAIVFHTKDIGNIKESALYVLTSTGAYPLKGKLSNLDLQRECGNPIQGIGFQKKGHDGFLIATGKDIDKIIKFHPAKSDPPQSNKTCLKENPKEQIHLLAYTSAGLNGTIQQVRWKRKLTKEDIEKQCDDFAKWNVKIDSSKIYKKLYEECIKLNSIQCADEERVVINLQEKSGKCLEITNSAIDCDGKAGIGVDLREFLGVLKIEYRTIKETWLLWNAPGYEGDGIYAIEINDILKKNRLLQEWLVYNGC